jgi:hypothetical protein
MDFDTSRKRAVRDGIRVGLDALDAEIDKLGLPSLFEDLCHNIVKSVDDTAENAISKKQHLRKFEKDTTSDTELVTAGVVKRIPGDEELSEPRVTEQKIMNDRADKAPPNKDSGGY